ncbi:unnamed protein product [Protopolystoma xenopodis]|uniref:Cadherin domain-containing protein n=1 Tax=Protopolystoma xenopodis TaxID=117903 RepID=A0A3S4ZQB1_9PLAT|nr:unnamed protein product [Protopolystoma xenopodis]
MKLLRNSMLHSEGKVIATDADINANGNLTYSIRQSTGPADLFDINARSGVIFLLRQVPLNWRASGLPLPQTSGKSETGKTTGRDPRESGDGLSNSETRWLDNTDTSQLGGLAQISREEDESDESLASQLDTKNRYEAGHNWPPYLVRVEACDQGQKPRCSSFSNLQIQVVILAFVCNPVGIRLGQHRFLLKVHFAAKHNK